MPESAEVLRLRDRVHKLTNDVIALRYQLQHLDLVNGENRKRIIALEETVLRLSRGEEIEQAVREERGLQLTVAQKILATIVALVALASSFKILVGL